jgi:hypothetical protein
MGNCKEPLAPKGELGKEPLTPKGELGKEPLAPKVMALI